jgi:mannose-6-phosphate isomerase
VPPSNPVISAVRLPSNPVWRSYAGGQILRQFRGQPRTADDHFPEDWLASCVRARNGTNSQGANEGLSPVGVSDSRQTVAEALSQTPDFWFGPQQAHRSDTGVLWKLLDSSVRLQFQAHPSADFARKHLNSNAGKTECWYILGTRREACVYLGFQRPPTREVWAQMIREQRVDDMLACFERIPVKPGDCYVVPAGTPHAIGAGVFMVELMEPTDWVVRCETVTAGVKLTPDQCFIGLTLEHCLDIFDYRAHPLAEVRKTFQQTPRSLQQTPSFTEEELISPAWHEFFRLHRLRGTGEANWSGSELMLLIALKGAGELIAGGEIRTVRSGETWLLPGAVSKWEWRNHSPDWEYLLAKLPIAPQNSVAIPN